MLSLYGTEQVLQKSIYGLYGFNTPTHEVKDMEIFGVLYKGERTGKTKHEQPQGGRTRMKARSTAPSLRRTT